MGSQHPLLGSACSSEPLSRRKWPGFPRAPREVAWGNEPGPDFKGIPAKWKAVLQLGSFPGPPNGSFPSPDIQAWGVTSLSLEGAQGLGLGKLWATPPLAHLSDPPDTCRSHQRPEAKVSNEIVRDPPLILSLHSFQMLVRTTFSVVVVVS